MSKLKTWICTGYPDEENIHFQNHTKLEQWECQAETKQEAFEKACRHFYYFHEILVEEKKQVKQK